MKSSFMPLLALSACVGASAIIDARADNRTLNSETEHGVQTECKKCPFSLCPNVAAYDYDAKFVLKCWTYGDSINNDTTWLGTTDGCYVTQWDIIEYDGNFDDALPYCGRIPKRYTTTPGRTKYNAECYIMPEVDANRIKMYKPNVDLTLTCIAHMDPMNDTALTDGVWYKTTSNCYVPQNLMQPVRGKSGLDNCGPIPWMLETKMRDPDPPPEIEAIVPTEPAEDAETAPDTELEETEPSKPEPAPSVASIARRATQFLYETYVGEEYAPCFSRPSNSSRLMKVYDYNETVTPQCGTRDDSLESLGTIWLLTIDWCYVDDALMDPNLIDSVMRGDHFPHCEAFKDTE